MSSALPLKNSSINPSEISHFSRDSDKWWDESGPFAPLHRINPLRIDYILNQISDHFNGATPAGKTLLDVGCGGGLLSEPLARLGANVTGIDADEQAITVARAHAQKNSASLTYRHSAVEDIDEQFDIVTALEIIEHVDNPDQFIAECAARVKPGGLLIVSTLNRTIKSFLSGIVAAEYVLRWVPRGTHNWNKFMKPAALARMIRDSGLSPSDITGVHYDPLKDNFSLQRSTIDVNYLLSAHKPLL